jgi:hypothetical protein
MRCLFFLFVFSLLALACRQAEKNAPAAAVAPAEPPAAETKSANEELYVHAANGLVLRKTPSKDGEKIATLTYGSLPVTALDQAKIAERFVAEKFDGQNIEGGWRRVRTHDGQEGYLFEGYLSRYPPVIESAEEGVEDLDWFYRTISPIQGGRGKTAQANADEGYTQNYADGARFDAAYFPGGVTYLLDIPDGKMSFQEAFVVLRTFCFPEGKGVKSSYDRKADAFVALKETEGFTELSVRRKPQGGFTVQLSYPD